ncbi:MAG: DMT family transporter [Microcella sp.]|uniref:DMT family transporter n=1 Tax=Microcella sp. TaxID=1913979 RepID=UPI003315CF48
MNALRRFSPAVLAQLFWASNFVVADRVVAEFSPLELTWLRWVGALPILVVVAWWLERPRWRETLREWRLHLLQAALGMVAYTLFLYSALESTSPVTASVITALNPAVIAIAAVIVLRERIRRLGVVGIVVSFAGVIVVIFTGQGLDAGLSLAPGDLLMLGAISVWTAYVIVSRRLTTPPITATTIQAAMSAVMLVPVVAVFGAPGIAAGPSVAAWWGLVWIMVFPSALAYLFWNIAVGTLGASKTGVFLNLLPVFTAVIALAFGDVLTVGQLVGGAIVLGGVYLTTRPGATQAPDLASSAPDAPADPARRE